MLRKGEHVVFTGPTACMVVERDWAKLSDVDMLSQ